MVIRVGVMGLSEGNGHPFSLSAIVNGYDELGMAASGWPVIHDYLGKRRADEFGFGDVQVTHAWTQDPATTARLCSASKIPNGVGDVSDMMGKVDAIIVARDDWQTHLPLAKPFLDDGIAVFVDKPLSLDANELDYFRPFLERGKLMSCSGLRHAVELEPLRANFASLGVVRSVNATVLIDWPRYGVHMLDAVFSLTTARPVSVGRNPASHESYSIAMSDGSVLSLDAIGLGPKTFHLALFGDKGRLEADLHDNFGAFRSTLSRFFEMVRTGVPAIAPVDTLTVMKTLMAGLRAQPGGGHVKL